MKVYNTQPVLSLTIILLIKILLFLTTEVFKLLFQSNKLFQVIKFIDLFWKSLNLLHKPFLSFLHKTFVAPVKPRFLSPVSLVPLHSTVGPGLLFCGLNTKKKLTLTRNLVISCVRVICVIIQLSWISKKIFIFLISINNLSLSYVKIN